MYLKDQRPIPVSRLVVAKLHVHGAYVILFCCIRFIYVKVMKKFFFDFYRFVNAR